MPDNMIDRSLCAELRDNEIVMESVINMMSSQVGKDKLRYIDTAIEAFANPTKQANLLNKLFKDIQKVEDIDFGRIPDSRGDLTKYVYYDQMYQCIEVLNDLIEGKPTPNITSMNKLHQTILNARNDFTFGFRTDNYIIISVYNLMVTSLYEMINVCAIDVTDYLRAKLSMQITSPTQKQIRWITKSTNHFIKIFESGQWSTLMKTFRSPSAATEASLKFSADTNNQTLNSGATILNNLMNMPENLKTLGGTLQSLIGKTVSSFHGKIVILIALLIAIRYAVYYFVNAVGKLSDRLKNVTSILKINIASESKPSTIEKQKTVLNGLENITDVIDYKILKSEKAATIAEDKSNKTDYNPQEINDITGADFEF